MQGFLLNLSETGLGDGLHSPSAPLPDAPGVRVSDAMSIGGLHVSFLDFVRPLPGNRMGRVKACLSEGGRLCCFLKLFVQVREINNSSGLWRVA